MTTPSTSEILHAKEVIEKIDWLTCFSPFGELANQIDSILDACRDDVAKLLAEAEKTLPPS